MVEQTTVEGKPPFEQEETQTRLMRRVLLMDSWEVEEKCGEGREVEQTVASHVRIKRSSRPDPGSLTAVRAKSSHIVCYVPKMSMQLNV